MNWSECRTCLHIIPSEFRILCFALCIMCLRFCSIQMMVAQQEKKIAYQLLLLVFYCIRYLITFFCRFCFVFGFICTKCWLVYLNRCAYGPKLYFCTIYEHDYDGFGINVCGFWFVCNFDVFDSWSCAAIAVFSPEHRHFGPESK